jgi:hypothetical protein
MPRRNVSQTAGSVRAAPAARGAAVAQDTRRGDHRPKTYSKSGNVGRNTGLLAMPAEMTEKQAVNRGETSRIETGSPDEDVSAEHETGSSRVVPPPGRQSTGRRRLLMGVLGALILASVGVLGIPWIRLMLNTVSTDDAYVNGHVTFVAPRVSGQISRVLVDDNYRVQKGELLAELDKEPFQIAVSQKKAAVRHRRGGPAGGQSRDARY